MCVWCGLSSPVSCNPIPMKAFFSSSLICVPWCPQVNHDYSKAIKCCSGVPSHLTLSQHFHLAHCLPLQPKKFQRKSILLTLDNQASYSTEGDHQCHDILIITCVVQPHNMNDHHIFKCSTSVCFLKLPLTAFNNMQ